MLVSASTLKHADRWRLAGDGLAAVYAAALLERRPDQILDLFRSKDWHQCSSLAKRSLDILGGAEVAEKKYQIFISSTYRDLIDERRAIARAVLDLQHIPAAMEHFPAMDEEQLEYIKQVIDECDYYVLVTAGKYGSVDNLGVSYTQREYEYAKFIGKTVLGFPIKDISKLRREQTETDPAVLAKLDAFRAEIMSGRLINTWEDQKDLELAVVKSLSAAFKRYPQDGWVRTPKSSTEDLLKEINEIRKENDNLKQQIGQINSSAVPLIEGLADFNDEYGVDLSITFGNDEVVSANSCTFQWRVIFISLVAAIKNQSQAHLVRRAFAANLITSTKTLSSSLGPHTIPRIGDYDYNVICTHFIAMSLLEEKPGLLFSLTKAGEQIYISSMAVRKH
ncbi:DUF4062 domain-containing protein [Methylobacterium sp. CM6246]